VPYSSPPPGTPPKIFICYSHKDEDWKTEVVSHLRVGHVQDDVYVWSDSQIRPGDTWQLEIRQAIEAATIAILLVSKDALNSDFINLKEIPAIMQRRKSEGMRLIPLIVGQCDWEGVDWLSKLQVLPANKKALEGKTVPQRNEDLTALAQFIRTSLTNTFEQGGSRDGWFTDPLKVRVDKKGTIDRQDERPKAELDGVYAFEIDHAAQAQIPTADRTKTVRDALDELRDADRDLAEAVSLCAIPPRLFDAAILGVLRGKPTDLDGNTRLLKTMREYSFVLPRRGGSYEYEHDVRELLLEDWRKDDTEQARFNTLNRDLATFYWTRYEERRRTDEETDQTAASDRAVVSASRPSLREPGAAQLSEAITCLRRVSLTAAYEFFEDHFDTALDEDRHPTCEALLEATRAILNRDEDEGLQDVLARVQLREARLWRRTQRSRRANEKLDELRAADGRATSATTRQEVLRELGDLLADGDSVGEALRVFDEVIKLASRPDAGKSDLALAHLNIAYPYWTLGRFDRALDEFREAMQLAGNSALGAFARSGLSAVLADQGRWQESWDVALDALDLARTEHRANATIASVVSRQLMSLVGARSPALVDTLFAEAMALRAPQTPRVTLDLQKDHAVALQEGGQLARAGEQLRQLGRDARRHPDPRFATSLLLQSSLVRIDERRLEQAADICSEVLGRLRESEGASGDQALARVNRAIAVVERIRAGTVTRDAVAQHWKYVEEDATAAAELFQKRGHRRLAALARGYLERTRAIDAPETDSDAWDEIRGELLDAPKFLAHYHMMRGDVEAQERRWSSAREHYRRASELHDSVDRPGEAAQSLQLCAAMAEREKDYAAATRIRAELGKRRWQLAEVDRYQPSAAAMAADEHNASAILLMSGTASEAGDVRRAREGFAAACALPTTVRWYYSLNLAYANAAQNDWDAAADALRTSLSEGPDWWRVPRLEKRLREFEEKRVDAVTAQGTREFHDGRIQQAADAFERALQLLAHLGRDVDREAEIRARIALVHLERNTLPAALAEVDRALLSGRRAEGDGTERSLPQACRSMIADVARYRRLMAQLTAGSVSSEIAAPLRKRLVELRDGLVAALDQLYELTPRVSAETVPFVVPIVLELGADLVPEDRSTERWSLFTVDIPQLHQRIQRDLGLDAPGIRVRTNPGLAGGQYNILIDEVRVVTGEAQARLRYVTMPEDPLSIASVLGAIASVHPATGAAGFWLPAAQAEIVEREGVASIEAIPFIVQHLEAVIRAHLSELIGLPEIDTLVKGWIMRTPSFAADVAELGARLRLMQTIQLLLDEQVPLTRPDDILSAFHAAPHSDAASLTAVIRRQLKPLLPGNESGRRRELLSEASERSLMAGLVREAGNEGATDFGPEDGHQTLGEIRQLLHPGRPFPALVVRNAALRPRLRRLIQSECPQLPVLAQEELQDEVRVSSDDSREPTVTGGHASE